MECGAPMPGPLAMWVGVEPKLSIDNILRSIPHTIIKIHAINRESESEKTLEISFEIFILRNQKTTPIFCRLFTLESHLRFHSNYTTSNTNFFLHIFLVRIVEIIDSD